MAIPVVIDTEIYQGKSTRSQNFGMEFSAKLARTLSSTLYNYKIEACVREYATNITDSHNDAGKVGLAGRIHLPTPLEPWYEAEDFGLGMTEDTIYSIYTIYGKSTKEHDNKTNGNLGYGSKAGFAVSDQFTITSVKDGVKTVVVCYKDRSGVPTADTKSIASTEEGNGTIVRVPVNTNEISAWHKYGARVLGAFETQHKVNTFGNYESEYLAVKDLCYRTRKEKSVYVGRKDIGCFEHRDTRFVLMGDVLYAIPDWEALVRCKQLLSPATKMTSGGVYLTHFDVGELDFAPSRESLSLDSKTFKKVSKRITEDVISYYRNLMKDVGGEDTTSWYLFYKKFFGTPVWEALSDYELPFTGNWTLEDTNPNRYNWKGTYIGYRIRFLSGYMKGCCGIVPSSRNDGRSVFNTDVASLSSDRIARIDNLLLVYSRKEKGLTKKKETLQNILAEHKSHDAVIYCNDEQKLAFAKQWFGVPEDNVVLGDKYTPTKSKKITEGNTRGSYGVTSDAYAVATQILSGGKRVYDKVNLQEENIFYVTNDSCVEVKGFEGTHTFYLSTIARKMDTFGINKIIVSNKNNMGKIKRNNVPSLSSYIQSLVKSRKRDLINTRVSRFCNISLNHKQRVVADKLRNYKKLINAATTQASCPVSEELASFSSFGVEGLQVYKNKVKKITEIKDKTEKELEQLKQKLPLWDYVPLDQFEYYLKLEKIIK